MPPTVTQRFLHSHSFINVAVTSPPPLIHPTQYCILASPVLGVRHFCFCFLATKLAINCFCCLSFSIFYSLPFFSFLNSSSLQFKKKKLFLCLNFFFSFLFFFFFFFFLFLFALPILFSRIPFFSAFCLASSAPFLSFSSIVCQTEGEKETHVRGGTGSGRFSRAGQSRWSVSRIP